MRHALPAARQTYVRTVLIDTILNKASVFRVFLKMSTAPNAIKKHVYFVLLDIMSLIREDVSVV